MVHDSWMSVPEIGRMTGKCKFRKRLDVFSRNRPESTPGKLKFWKKYLDEFSKICHEGLSHYGSAKLTVSKAIISRRIPSKIINLILNVFVHVCHWTFFRVQISSRSEDSENLKLVKIIDEDDNQTGLREWTNHFDPGKK